MINLKRSIDKTEERIILFPQPNDVLCQTGKSTFEHEGNRYFRAIIEDKKASYQAAPDRRQKSLILEEVVQHILNRGGRFLKRKTNKDHWVVASLRDAKDKSSYAFRRWTLDDENEKF
eukprot:CAMPEP_0194252396 /NCGR_PEP_ID=MMETSP0158-20130606/27494_1 /TAXON_ID=33649 /ORGANISM="Thalassionema nitzschioides, Strain L26-B" /LENGTH=117 /DNA_ID=CAMNT_0038989799 /DNA_START=73 /DNA_END=423 /DNA_ORIENTATION=-